MAIQVKVKMPQFGETVRDGTVTAWLKESGDEIKAGEDLCEIATDKVDHVLESPVSGRIAEITVAAEETVDVGVVLCVIESEGVLP